MRIISTTDISKVGNDTVVYESISLIEQFEIYAIIRCCKVVCETEVEAVEVIFSSSILKEAIKKYDELGGKI